MSKGVQPLLRMVDIVKAFPGTVAVNGVSFEVFPGEVLALVGQNGAGKSTLKNIICGILRPDSGEIEIEGQKLPYLTVHLAQELGISAVHQELSLFDTLTVKENICIALPQKIPYQDKKLHELVNKAFQRLGVQIDPDSVVGELSTGEKQLVEIAKALLRARRLIILDEPTTSLTMPERIRLYGVLRNLKKEGIGIIYISHFLDELHQVADRVLVLRDGKQVGYGYIKDFPIGRLQELIVGKSLKKEGFDIVKPHDEVVLKVENFVYPPYFERVNFELRKGEIVGLAGLIGAGRTELVEALYGLRPCGGTIWVKGKQIVSPKPYLMRQLGIGFIPENRHDALFEVRSLRENLTAAALEKMIPKGLLKVGFGKERTIAQDLVRRFQIVSSGIERPVKYLSGGNQQKVLFARWAAANSDILILDDPTRGVDVGVKEDYYRLIVQHARDNGSVIFISSDLSELLLVCHRILVFRNGRIIASFSREEFDEREILRCMVFREAACNEASVV